MKKKILSLALAFAMLAAIFPTVAFAANHSEEFIQHIRNSVKLENASSWAHDAIVNAGLKGWLGSAVTIDPNYFEYRNDITRAEYAILILQWINVETGIRIYEHDTRNPNLDFELSMDDGRTSGSTYVWQLNGIIQRLSVAYISQTVMEIPPWTPGLEGIEERVEFERQVPLNISELYEKHPEIYLTCYRRAEEFASAHRLGIVSQDNLNDPITREQAATMIMRAVNVVNLIKANEIPLYEIGQHSQTFINAPTADFADMTQVSSENANGVNFVSANNIMGDAGGNTFDPKGLVTVERAIVSINNIGKVEPIDTASSWARDGITNAIEKGFVPENIQGSYQNTITRAEFCRMAVKWVEYATGKTIDAVLAENGKTRDPSAFTDVTNSDILAAAALGITSGVGNNRFDPGGQFTRQQAATMILNTCKVIGADTENPPPSGFSDIYLADGWAHTGIDFVRAHGIMSGTGDGFNPKGIYTREQSIVTFNNIVPEELPPISGPLPEGAGPKGLGE